MKVVSFHAWRRWPAKLIIASVSTCPKTQHMGHKKGKHWAGCVSRGGGSTHRLLEFNEAAGQWRKAAFRSRRALIGRRASASDILPMERKTRWAIGHSCHGNQWMVLRASTGRVQTFPTMLQDEWPPTQATHTRTYLGEGLDAGLEGGPQTVPGNVPICCLAPQRWPVGRRPPSQWLAVAALPVPMATGP